jgi:hypothetical protein
VTSQTFNSPSIHIQAKLSQFIFALRTFTFSFPFHLFPETNSREFTR